ncbi:MAG: hypothetical protein WDO73_02965 [Ignavibacteriota bacterium]
MNPMQATLERDEFQPSRPTLPDRVEDLGIPRAMVADLFLRYLWLHGSGTLEALHRKLMLSFPILETMFHQFRQQQLLEVKGMVGNDYAFSLTSSGRALATARSEVCAYVGPAPVSLQQYDAVVKSQTAHIQLNRESLRQAFSDLVLPDNLLDSLGPSLIGHQSLFLYGGTGNGKTSIAERILRIYEDTVLIPYCVEVDGHIITLFDPVVHQAVGSTDELLDPRWAVCKRPLHHGGWRAFLADVGVATRRQYPLLHRSVSNEGQQRHSDHRRFRTSDDVSAGIAQPLGGAARSACRLPDVVLRHEISGPVRTHGGLFHQYESERSG